MFWINPSENIIDKYDEETIDPTMFDLEGWTLEKYDTEK